MMEKQKPNLFRLTVLFAAMLPFYACSHATPAQSAQVVDPFTAHPSQGSADIRFDKNAVVEGAAFKLEIESKSGEIENLNGEFIERKFKFIETTKNGANVTYLALVGIEYGAEIKEPKLILHGIYKDSKTPFDSTLILAVKPGIFPSEKLSVPPKTISPSKKDLAQIAKDNAFLKTAYADTVDEKLWDSNLIMPVEDKITSVYGSHRVYNGKHISPHLGTDFRAPTGTPIKSPLSGRVVCARTLFYTGNTVILDHGYGFFTVYGHMSKLNVKEGSTVKKAAVLGLSGMTGRASGPHLHWGVKLHGAKIDPMSIVSILK